MIVLTAGNRPLLPGVTQAAQEGAAKDVKDAHERLAARSTRGQSIVVPNSAHFVQIDQPQAVIDAIAKVVTEVRGTAAAR